MDDRKTNWPLTIFLLIVSAPILIMYLWLFIDSMSEINVDSIWPKEFTLRNWRFLVQDIPGTAASGRRPSTPPFSPPAWSPSS